jgi:uncharacterized membrane protein YkvA (DUF1232 family)
MVTITVDIDDKVKEHFNKFIEEHGTNIDINDIKEAKQQMIEVRASTEDSYLLDQISALGTMIRMVEDEVWHVSDVNLSKINATIKYFVDEDDIIPDNIPGIGYLDDCIIIDNTADEIYDEIMEYKDFCKTRLVYAQDKNFTFEDWQKVKNQELSSRVRNRMLRRSRSRRH